MFLLTVYTSYKTVDANSLLYGSENSAEIVEKLLLTNCQVYVTRTKTYIIYVQMKLCWFGV